MLDKMRLLTIVEALTVTGPVKPMLMFSPLASAGVPGYPPVIHSLMTTRRTAPSDRDPLYIAVKDAGIAYFAIPEAFAFDPRVLGRMNAAIRAVAPDLIETHDSKSHFLQWVLRRLHSDLRRIPWVAFHHGYTQTSWKMSLYQQLDRMSLPAADQVVTLCKPFEALLAGRGVDPKRLHVISNTVTPRAKPSEADIRAARERLNATPDSIVLSTVGRLSAEKAQIDLLRAFAQVLERSPGVDLKLAIVGDGPERALLEREAASLGSKVAFTGQVSDPWPLFHASDIFVLPSHSEGSPLVIFEAMAAEIPIVSTAVGGVPEVLSHEKTALLVPPQRPLELAEAIARLVRDAELRRTLGAAAANELSRYTPGAYARQLLGIYEAARKARLDRI